MVNFGNNFDVWEALFQGALITFRIGEGARKGTLKIAYLTTNWLADCGHWVFYGSDKNN